MPTHLAPHWQCRFRYLGRNETTIEESEITTNCLIVNFHFSHFAFFRANGFYFHFESRDKKSAKRTEKSCLEIQIIVVRWHFIFFYSLAFLSSLEIWSWILKSFFNWIPFGNRARLWKCNLWSYIWPPRGKVLTYYKFAIFFYLGNIT